MIAIEQLTKQLLALGVRPGGVLVVHTSFKQVGRVDGGPLGLIAALRAALGPDGTLVMPTMTDGASRFDPASTPTYEMGITAETFFRQPGVLRSTHPGASFAAEGPLAARICQPQPLSPPHGPDSPIGRVVDHAGQVLLLGVDHDANTSLHVAEALAQVPYAVEHPCVVECDGRVETVLIAETDHCCQGFNQMNALLRACGLQHEARVGAAHARLCDARVVVELARAELARDPLYFLCPPGAACEECARARASVTLRTSHESV